MKVAAFALLAFALQGAVAAQDRPFDAGRSQLAFTYKVAGNILAEGRFPRFDAQVSFDEKRPEQGHIRVEVDVGAIDTGSTDGDAEARRTTWFDSVKFPKAVFESSAIRRTGDRRYEANGNLNMKGMVKPVTVPFTIESSSAVVKAQGALTIKRLAFGLGTGEWADTSQIADEVALRFTIVLGPSRQ